MKIFGIILFIIMAIVSVVAFFINTKKIADSIKESKLIKVDFLEVLKKSIIFTVVFSFAFTLMLLSIYLWAVITPVWYELFAAIVGGLFFGITASASLNLFLIHYYGKDIETKLDKWLFRLLAIVFPLTLVFVFLLSDGFASYLTYPLVNGINFDIGFVRPGEASPNLAFYALCILSGAFYVYLLCDHKFYQQYGKHGILESTFLIAFPAGIIGARIFYVIGQWNTDFGWNSMSSLYLFGQDIPVWAPLAIWEGGLTILGGAFTGVVVGVAWFLTRRKQYSIWVAVDIIVPTILIAQAVGRWGNFFNTEVHGTIDSLDHWRWLPEVIWRQMQYGRSSGVFAGADMIYVPLFLIEGITNFLGYFIIAHLFGNKLRHVTELGDLAFGYFIWYGLTRATLEPLRHEDFIMNDLWSWFWGLAFIVGGVLLIVLNHYIRHFISERKNKTIKHDFKKSLIALISVSGSSIVVLVAAITFMVNSDYTLAIALTNFNIAVLLYVVAGSLLLIATIPALYLYKSKKNEEVACE